MEHEILRQVCLITQRRMISLLYIYNYIIFFYLTIYILSIYTSFESVRVWAWASVSTLMCMWVNMHMNVRHELCSHHYNQSLLVQKEWIWSQNLYHIFFFFFLCLPPSKYSCSIMPTMLVSFPEFLLHIDSPVLSATKDIWLR